MSQHKTIIVEGLIGAGKTTITKEIGKLLGHSTLVLLEPDEKNNLNPYLSLYYADPSRWSLALQINQLARRFRMQQHSQWHVLNGYGDAVIDRSYQGDVCFGNLQYKLGYMSSIEFDTYELIYHAMTSFVLKPNICIRLLTTPERCIKRITRRMEQETGRKCESSIELSYLYGLDQEINDLVDVLQSQGVSIIPVDWDEELCSEDERSNKILKIVENINNVSVPTEFKDRHRRMI